MRAILLIVFLVSLLSASSIAAPKQGGQSHLPPSVLDKLFSQLAQAENPEDAHPIEDKINAEFRHSGSPSVDLLMSRVQIALSAADNKTAKQLLDAVTTIAPSYAEGWHGRADMEAAAGDDTDALVSLQKAVLLNPRNFTALEELADLLEEYGDKAGALKLYRRALALDPQLEGVSRKVRGLTRAVEGQNI